MRHGLYFVRKHSEGHVGVCPQLEKNSRSILKKHGGLPLAIVAIGTLLSRKNEAPIECKKSVRVLQQRCESDSALISVQKILLLSYNIYLIILNIVSCTQSVFLEDHLIKRVKIVQLQKAERLDEEKRGLKMEEVAVDYFNELVNRSMIHAIDR